MKLKRIGETGKTTVPYVLVSIGLIVFFSFILSEISEEGSLENFIVHLGNPEVIVQHGLSFLIVPSFIVTAVLFNKNDRLNKNLEKSVAKRTKDLEMTLGQLKDSEEIFHAITDCANDAIILIDNDGNIAYWNVSAEVILGYNLDEVMGKNLHHLLAPKRFHEAHFRGFNKFRDDGMGAAVGKTLELAAIRKDGTEISIALSLSALKLKDKWFALGMIRDISKQKKMEDTRNKHIFDLGERVKELGCLYGISKLIETPSILLKEVLQGISNLLSSAWQYPDITCSRIFVDNLECKTENFGETCWKQSADIKVKGKKVGVVEVFYLEEKEFAFEGPFLEEERFLIDVVAKRIGKTIELMKSESAIKESMKLINKSNEELENYTYVVSHDLKAPLRAIKSFSSFILEDYVDKIDETGQEYLKRIGNAAENMDRLIEDLLLLSRVGRKFSNFESVDLNHMLNLIKSDFESSKSKQSKIVVGKLPTIFVQKTWIRQLFMNLIDNGLKFNESEVPTLEIGSEEMDDHFLFSVRDNGIGIEKRYFEKVFKLFERLHSKEQYEGTGAGLAICQKIVAEFDGKIWVESLPGKGSTFFFTVPKIMEQTIGELGDNHE